MLYPETITTGVSIGWHATIARTCVLGAHAARRGEGRAEEEDDGDHKHIHGRSDAPWLAELEEAPKVGASCALQTAVVVLR